MAFTHDIARSRRGPVLWKVAAAIAAIPLVLVGCSSSGKSGGSDSSTKIDYVGLKAFIAKYTGVPKYTPKGSPIDVSKIKGKTIFDIPEQSGIPVLQVETEKMKSLAAKAGVNFVSYTNQATPDQWVAGIKAAIARHANVIDLSGAPNPKLLEPQIRAAKAAGIPTTIDHNYDRTEDSLSVLRKNSIAASTPGPFSLAMTLVADYSIVQSKGKVNALIVAQSDITPNTVLVNSLKNEFAKSCGSGCKTTVLDIQSSGSSSDITHSIQTALLRDPTINYVIPEVDFLALDAIPAVNQLSTAKKPEIVTYNGTAAVLDALRSGNVVAMDVGESFQWIAYTAMDQNFRILAGQAPITDPVTPVRVWTKDNVAQAGVPAKTTDNFPEPTGYLSLWGLDG